jgi:predicted DNA-binding transcriptional regulator AlpA
VRLKFGALSKTPVVKTSHTSVFDQLPDSAFVRESQLVQSPKRPNSTAPLPFSAPTLWRKVKTCDFPAPVKLSARVTCWQVGAIRAWMSAQAAQTYTPALVAPKRSKNALATV